MSLPPEIDFAADPAATTARMNRAMEYLYLGLKAAAARQPEYEAAIEEVRTLGLLRLAEVMTPLLAQAYETAGKMQVLHDRYLDDGVTQTIIAQATAAGARDLATAVRRQDDRLAESIAAAARTFAGLGHRHAIGDVDGLREELSLARGIWRTYTANAIWAKPAGLVSLHIVAIGGGAGGGGGGTTPNSNAQGGLGGGGGGYSAAFLRASTLPDTVEIVVGAGGQGGNASTDPNATLGLAGGNTNFGGLLTAFGGAPGVLNGTRGTAGLGANAALAAGAGGEGASLRAGALVQPPTYLGKQALITGATDVFGYGVSVPDARHGGSGGSGGNDRWGHAGGLYGGGGGGGSAGRVNKPGWHGDPGAPGIVVLLEAY